MMYGNSYKNVPSIDLINGIYTISFKFRSSDFCKILSHFWIFFFQDFIFSKIRSFHHHHDDLHMNVVSNVCVKICHHERIACSKYSV